MQHSAGSGKSNTVALLTHRLSSLHDADDHEVFDKVVVITDRLALDRQLQETIYQFECAQGVVEKVDRGSRQLTEAPAGKRITRPSHPFGTIGVCGPHLAVRPRLQADC